MTDFAEKPIVQTRLDGIRILLAEDSPDNQLLMKRFLSRSGAIVEVADNGAEAVKQAMANEYDVVLMDMQMPILDGYGATAELRRQGFVKPIIALTAHAMREDREKSISAGCTDYLSKPVSFSNLIDLVARYAAI